MRPFLIRAGGVLVRTLLLLSAVLMLMPALGTAGGAPTGLSSVAAVSVEATAVVGSYDVASLKADNAAALDAWLSERFAQTYYRRQGPLAAATAKWIRKHIPWPTTFH